MRGHWFALQANQWFFNKKPTEWYSVSVARPEVGWGLCDPKLLQWEHDHLVGRGLLVDQQVLEGLVRLVDFEDMLRVFRGWGRARGWGQLGLATNSISFCFLLVKYYWFAWRANQWPLIGELLFSSVPSSNSLVSVSDPWRAFWADTAPFKGPRLASCVASGITEKQGHCQVCRARHGGSRTLSRTDYAKPWLCVCWKRTFSHRSLIVKIHQNRIELVTRPEDSAIPEAPARVFSSITDESLAELCSRSGLESELFG